MGPGQADRAVLLDLKPHVPIDVLALDRTIATFYQRPNELEGKQAGETLTLLRDHKDAWEHYRQIIEKSSSQQTKYFALQILEEVVRFRWGALPAEKAMEIRDYVTNLIIGLSSNDTTFRQEKTFLNKLNIILVQIVKHVWPQRWESFIPELVGASKRSETLCENSMVILKLLSEEVFDFAKGDMTKAKTAKLKKSLNKEFTLILELCGFVLNASNKTDLIRATLVTLDAYLSWVPLGYIIHSNMIEALLKLFPQTEYRNVALQCLTEVAALTLEDEWNSHFVNMYNIFIQQLQVIVSNPAAIPAAYEQGTDEEQKFTQNLALFFTTFYKAHLKIVEKSSEQALLIGMDYLLNISFVSDDEIFKICLDYWNFFVPSIYSAVQISSGFSNGAFPGFGSSHVLENSRKRLYSQVLSRLRLLMITRMAKPEEVIVVEDENGNIVRETMKDTDTLARYKTMHETLVYLSHLDHEDTEEQMLSKLHLQSSGKEGSWQALNTLCWAIGSISGSMAEEQENRFLVTVIRDLLNLCEMTRGKDNKAVIAANIMYVVGQYPTFLRNHWKFLKTVVNKLFEFMHERHPGVQDMACETFLKICHTCKRKFVVQQMGETEPFISTLLRGLAETTNELEPHQVHMFYEAVGLMISSDSDPSRRNVWLDQLMGQPNAIWQSIAENALPNNLKDTETMKHVLNILHKNVSVCTSLGTAFIPQMGKIFTSLLKLYRAYSELISTGINANGPHHAKTTLIKQMRSCKRVALKLLQTFVERCDDTRLLSQDMVPAMSNIILGDYALNVPDARESEVLALFAAIINRLKDKTEKDVPAIFEGIFDSTLGMITKNFEDYPEHRLNFFALLRVIINEVPSTLFQLAPHQLKVVIDAILWAIRHKERNIAELGLNTMLEMLSIVDKNEVATQFYQHFHGQFVSEIFHVMTDGLHKPGLKLQARILYHLISVVRSGVIKQPLWDVSSQGPNPPADNVTYVKQQMVILLMRNHSHMNRAEVEAFVQAMFASGNDASKFKQLLRDFLIVTKTIASEDNNNPLADNTNLLADEQAERLEATRLDPQRIPGMQNPNARQEEQMGD